MTLEALPIGTISIRIDGGVPRRFIKLSHHGHWRSRWRPLARHRWESQVGPIPAGYRVEFRDSLSLHDELENLVLTRADRFKVLLQRPNASRNQKVKRRSALQKSNRDRVRVADSQLKPWAWYVVLPLSKAIVWVPHRNRKEARELHTDEQLATLCDQEIMTILYRAKRPRNAEPFEPGHPVEILRGQTIADESGTDGKCEGFIRLIPDTRKPPRKRVPKLLPPDLVTVCGDGYLAAVIEPVSNPYQLEGGDPCLRCS